MHVSTKNHDLFFKSKSRVVECDAGVFWRGMTHLEQERTEVSDKFADIKTSSRTPGVEGNNLHSLLPSPDRLISLLLLSASIFFSNSLPGLLRSWLPSVGR